MVRTPSVFNIWTSKCASRHNGVHFFDISTSKSGPNVVCFVHFDLEMCFAPQRRALFRHLNFQKWSELGVLCILTWKCASRHDAVHFFEISTSKSGPRMVCFVHFDLGMCFGHNGVQFFISHLASWLRTRRFSEPPYSAFHLSILSEARLLNFLRIYIYIYIYNTSSTAQGGGGSFKNRKPIGEVGCCESGMAERSH